MNRLVALALLAASLVLFGFAVDAEAQSYVAPAATPAQTVAGFNGR